MLTSEKPLCFFVQLGGYQTQRLSRSRRSPARPGASHTPSRPCGATCASSCSRRRARSLSSPRRGRAPRSRAPSSSGARETGPPSWRTSSQWAPTRRPPSRLTRSPRRALLRMSPVLSTPIISPPAPLTSQTEATACWANRGMVGVPMREPVIFSCSDPKLSDAQTRK